MTSPKESDKHNTKNKATQDEGAPHPFFHLEPNVLACMSLTLEERDALQHEELSSPPSCRTVRGQLRSFLPEVGQAYGWMLHADAS